MEKLGPEDPQQIGAYRLLARLGAGGMGQVFLARSSRGRTVAVKLVRQELAEQEEFRSRFRHEVAAARRVGGRWTAPVLDADTEATIPWVATGYVAGPSLQSVVSPGTSTSDTGAGARAAGGHGPLPERSVHILGAGLANALKDIHGAGLIHRDLKPSNVLITIDGPRVIDFGISRVVDATQVTRTDAVIGTPGFMAPEQIVSSREAGPAADVFSLGCVLAFAATGRGPFGTGNTAEILYRAVHAPPQLDGVPDGLRPLLAACLEKEPADRPPAGAVLAALGSADPSALLTPGLREDLARREAHAAVLVAAPPMPVTPLRTAAPSGPSRRRFLWIAAAGGTAAAAAGATALVEWKSKPDRTPSRGSSSARTTVRPVAELAAGPKPLWSSPLKRLQRGQLQLLGDTLVHWEDRTAIGYDTANGKKQWTASPRVPSDVSSGLKWLGVQGSTLYASASGDRAHLLGLDGNGDLKFSHSVFGPEGGDYSPDSIQDVFCVVGSVAVIGTMSQQAYQMRAVDINTGKLLWSRKMQGNDFGACSDGHICFVHDVEDVRGVDLRSGRVLWSRPKVLSGGAYPKLASDGNVLLVTTVKVQAFRASDGTTPWTAVNEAMSLSPTRVRGKRAYVTDSQNTVFALDTRNGKQLWHRASPLPLSSSSTANSGPAVSSSLMALPVYGSGNIPGFIVLRASDGKPLWAHRPSGAEAKGKDTWRLLITDTTIYAASATTLYAFRSDPQ